jgi:hypothetical protein
MIFLFNVIESVETMLIKFLGSCRCMFNCSREDKLCELTANMAAMSNKHIPGAEAQAYN